MHAEAFILAWFYCVSLLIAGSLIDLILNGIFIINNFFNIFLVFSKICSCTFNFLSARLLKISKLFSFFFFYLKKIIL